MILLSVPFLRKITCHFLSAHQSHFSCEDLCGVSGEIEFPGSETLSPQGPETPPSSQMPSESLFSHHSSFQKDVSEDFQGDSEHPTELLRDTSQRMHLDTGMCSAKRGPTHRRPGQAHTLFPWRPETSGETHEHSMIRSERSAAMVRRRS